MQPVMMVSDLGLTFGRANVFNRNGVGSANFEGWAAADIWLDPERCIGNLPRSHTGTLENPAIKEPGRKFLADLLVQLSDAQLRDLFEVSRIVRARCRPASRGARSRIGSPPSRTSGIRS